MSQVQSLYSRVELESGSAPPSLHNTVSIGLPALEVHEAAHGHTAEPCPVGISTITSHDATHGHAATPCDVTQLVLAPAGCSHAHAADHLSVAVPPGLVIAGATHAHTSDGLVVPPQVSLLRNLGAWHSHRAVKHFYRLDFAYGLANDTYPGQVQLAFSLNRPIGVAPVEATVFGLAAAVNAAQGWTFDGHDSLQLGSSQPVVGKGSYVWKLRLRAQTATLPVLFDFKDGSEFEIIPVNTTLGQTADVLNVVHTSPLSAQDTGQAQASDHIQITQTTPLQNLSAVLPHTAGVLDIGHQILFRDIFDATHTHSAEHAIVVNRALAAANDTHHTHLADQPSLTHTSPLVTDLDIMPVLDDLEEIRNWSSLFLAGAHQAQTAQRFAVTHFSPLVIPFAWHYHRCQRLSFLPKGWVFREILDTPRVNRLVAVDRVNRETETPVVSRLVDIDQLVREVETDPPDRTAGG